MRLCVLSMNISVNMIVMSMWIIMIWFILNGVFMKRNGLGKNLLIDGLMKFLLEVLVLMNGRIVVNVEVMIMFFGVGCLRWGD